MSAVTNMNTTNMTTPPTSPLLRAVPSKAVAEDDLPAAVFSYKDIVRPPIVMHPSTVRWPRLVGAAPLVAVHVAAADMLQAMLLPNT